MILSICQTRFSSLVAYSAIIKIYLTENWKKCLVACLMCFSNQRDTFTCYKCFWCPTTHLINTSHCLFKIFKRKVSPLCFTNKTYIFMRRNICQWFLLQWKEWTRLFLSTHRDAKLGNRYVVRVDTETHTLLDVWSKAPGFWWALTFLLSGAPERIRRGEKKEGILFTVDKCTHKDAHGNLIRNKECPSVLKQVALETFIIFPRSGNKPDTMKARSLQWWEQLHIKQRRLYMWK